MANRLSGMAGLAVLSAVLASFIYNPLGGSTEVLARTPVLDIPLPPSIDRVDVLPLAGATETAAPEIRVEPRKPAARVRIPVGCERLVSVLVRSAAADQVGRCVT